MMGKVDVMCKHLALKCATVTEERGGIHTVSWPLGWLDMVGVYFRSNFHILNPGPLLMTPYMATLMWFFRFFFSRFKSRFFQKKT